MTSQESSAEGRKGENMGWRVSVSILTLFGLIIALIIWAFFYASTFTSYQNAAFVVVAIFTFVAVMGATWAPWGMRQSGVDHR